MARNILLYVMSAGYLLAGLNHFRKPGFYLGIMPGWLPAPHFLNALTGVVEILLGLALLLRNTRPTAACGLAVLLVLFFSVHIHMLQLAYRNPGYFMSVGMGWLRIGIQFVLIAWALWYRR
ncbi:MAG: hypothetical protein JWP27_2627 [Flaviaesturariibacter sp.]|nr:hypothetical protein [Flaviaesturariibacter sp.]